MDNVTTTIEQRISSVRARIAALLLEIDDIVLQVNPQIEAEYATKIGYLENDLLKWQIAARRAKRRYALAQARVNAGLCFMTNEFDAQLDAELSEWEGRLVKSVNAFLVAVERVAGSRVLSPEKSRELRLLHRELIKRLHPDLHPGQSDAAARFFQVAQSAYENGDLRTLRSLIVATAGMDEDDSSFSSDDEAYAELELAYAQERVAREQLDELKRSNPYALRAKLDDGAWVLRYTTELKSRIAGQKAAAKAYDERFVMLAGGEQDGCF